MAKLDGMRYPSGLTAEEAVKLADILIEEFDGEANSKEAFAQALGHSTSSSGSYIKKVADARNYGVLPTRGLKATDLAYRVTNPKNETEEMEAVFEMYSNVSILSELYGHLNGDKPPGNLWSVLIEITEADRNDAKEAASDIRDLYESMLEYDIEGASEPRQSEEGTQKEKDSMEDTSTSSSSNEIYIKIGNDEHRFEKVSDLNIRIAMTILKSKMDNSAEGGEHDQPTQAKLEL